MRFPMLAAILFAASYSSMAPAQTADTTCQRLGTYTNCSTQYRDAPSSDRFRVDLPDIAGSFERGRAQARQAQREELELELLRQQAQQRDLRRELDQEQAQLQTGLLHQQSEALRKAEQEKSDAFLEDITYWSQLVGACRRIAEREHGIPQPPPGFTLDQPTADRSKEIESSAQACTDKLLVTDPRFAKVQATLTAQ